MPLRLVSKFFKEIVDSIIFSNLKIQHETIVISYVYEKQNIMDRFTNCHISEGYPFPVAGLIMDQFHDEFGIISPDKQTDIFCSYYQFKSGRDLFLPRYSLIHLFLPKV